MNSTETPREPVARVIGLERGTDPFSGLPTVWAGALLPDVAPDADVRAEIDFDGILKSWMPLRANEAPAGGSAFNIQVLEDAGLQSVRVFLRGPATTELLIELPLAKIHRCDAGAADGANAAATEPHPSEPVILQHPALHTRARHLARQLARRVRSGDVLRPRIWHAWSKRLARKVAPRPAESPILPPDPRSAPRSSYAAHIANNDLSPRRRIMYQDEAQGFSNRPTISIVMPVFNVAVRYLRAAVASVQAQIYERWELCIADDASTDPELRAYLRYLAHADARVKVVFRPRNGHICAASNSASELASGDFIAFMDNDDTLAPDALFHYVRQLQCDAAIDVFFSDEDKIDASGRRYDPQFKPDWSPDLFLSYNYINHFTCVRREAFEAAGRFRIGYEGGQDYDLLWRVFEGTDRIHHVPRVLYHWRALPTSTAATAAVKPVMFDSCERALRDHLRRTGIAANPYTPEFAQRLRLPISLLDFPGIDSDVAIFVPATDQDVPTARWLLDLRRRTVFPCWDITILDLTTAGGEAAIAVHDLAETGVPIVRLEARNAMAAVNEMALRSSAEFVLLLSPSLLPAETKWLSRLVGYARRSGVGCVGARVVDDDGRVRHAGIVLDMFDETAPDRAFAGSAADEVSYYFQAEVARTVSAIGSECLLTRRQSLIDLGGFDASRLSGDAAAIDYCRQLAARKLRCVYVGGVELIQANRPITRDDPREVRVLQHKHGRGPDPYYNPNLSRRFSFHIASGCPHAPDVPAGRPVDVLCAAHNLSATEGAPRYLYDIATGLQARGRIRTTVFSPLPGPGQGLYERHGIRVHVGRLSHAHKFLNATWGPAEYEETLEYVANLLTSLRPDVVVANTLGNFPMIEAANRAGVPSVWVIHESYSPDQMKALHSAFALGRCHAAFALADRVVIASHDTARLFDGVNSQHTVEVVHNGLQVAAIEDYCRTVTPADAARLISGPAGRKRITSIGTVCERKSQHTLVDAAARLKARGRNDFCVYLVGARDTSLSYLNAIRATIERKRLSDCILLIPETEDVRPYLRSTDVFVCASRVEAFSRSMLEAEAFGLPIVTTPCCGANEQVVWGHNALRFDMGDAGQLADHLERLLTDDDLRRQMGECSRAVYDTHLTNEDMVVRYERLILNIWLQAAAIESHAAQASAA